MHWLLVVLIASAAQAFHFDGVPAGCVFSRTLTPYGPAPYNTSSVLLNSAFAGWNMPALLYNGPGPYAFDIPLDTAGAGVIGKLPDNTGILGLSNINAF